MKPSDQPSAAKTVHEMLEEIKSYFAILANTERLSLAGTEEPNTLCLNDATHIGGTGLDLIAELEDWLKPANAPPASTPSVQNADPLGELKHLPLDRIVEVHLHSGASFTGALAESPDNQVILFELGSDNASCYHVIPIASIEAWSDMRGASADPLFLYNGKHLTQSQIAAQESETGR
ncbi:hypothetical protein [Microvirga roseola]|uniref:hypothetical protein n=1 Tax=Microvirga roseola TaxID=2883126 RepID=UPI001E6113BE|nr:hypothetical protein [Microvirga roseola]